MGSEASNYELSFAQVCVNSSLTLFSGTSIPTEQGKSNIPEVVGGTVTAFGGVSVIVVIAGIIVCRLKFRKQETKVCMQNGMVKINIYVPVAKPRKQ
jgi:hypothetical protein